MVTIAEALHAALEHQRQGRLPQAEELYRQVLDTDPKNVDALHLLGVIASQAGQCELAVKYISRAIEFQSQHAAFHVNLAEAYRKWGKLAEAIATAREAVRLFPDFADAHHALGGALHTEGRFDEALACYARAVELSPDDADPHYNRALVWLTQGNYARGWPEYEWRWRKAGFVLPSYPVPRWDGAPLRGRSLLVQCEQGLGDTVQFIRYLKLLESQGENAVVVVQQPLVRLLAGSGFQGVVAPGSPLPRFDAYAPIMSLPSLFGTTLETVPANVPYLAPARELAVHWRTRLAATAGFKVGIHWQGNPLSPYEPARSMRLAEFERIALPGVRLVSLQKGFGAEQIAAARGQFELLHFGDELDEAHGPFADTAALMTAVDLVVTSDTVTAHLAGALGVPVWVPLSFEAEWRWMRERSDSPWYPTMRLFRQTERGDWAGVFRRMAVELSALAASRRPSD